MPRTAKGARGERELLDLLWSSGAGAVRVAGSGSTGRPSADLIAAGPGGLAVIEVKVTSKDAVYVDSAEVRSASRLASAMGGRAYVAVKFTSLRTGDFFIVPVEKMERVGSTYKITVEWARRVGVGAREFGMILAGRISQLK